MYCDECGEYHHNSEIYDVIDAEGQNSRACESCVEDHFRTCDCCSRIVHDNRILECNDEWICEECAAKQLEEGA